MRVGLITMMLVAFAGLGIYDIHAGHYKTGAISLLLTVVNGLVMI